MNKKLLAVLLITAVIHVHAQIAPLTELAAQRYGIHIPRILQDLKEYRLNSDVQDSIKKVLIYKHLGCFPPSHTTLSYPFGALSVSFSPDGQYILVTPALHEEIDEDLSNDGIVRILDLSDITSTERERLLASQATASIEVLHKPRRAETVYPAVFYFYFILLVTWFSFTNFFFKVT